MGDAAPAGDGGALGPAASLVEEPRRADGQRPESLAAALDLGRFACKELRPLCLVPETGRLLFHPDLLFGTQLGRRIHDYTFFDYDQREALHLSEREQRIVIDLSKQYVLDKELTLNQVAYKLGFQYLQHFTRLFKKEVGMTPSEYRN